MAANILITGGRGFLGYHLTEYLIGRGFSITTFSRKESNLTHSEFYLHIRGDITDFSKVNEAVKNADGVIHLAAISRESLGDSNPYDCIKTNVLGTLNVLESVKSLPIKPWIILASSAAVKEVITKDGNHTLKTANSMYGISKLFNELCACRYSIKYLMRITALRFESIYGSTRDNTDKVINKIIIKALANDTIEIYEGNKKMNFIHYRDIVKAFSIVIGKFSSLDCSCYNDIYLGSPHSVTLEELANKIAKLCKSKSRISIHKDGTAKYNNFRSKTELDRSSDFLDFCPSISLEEGLQSLIKQHHSNRE